MKKCIVILGMHRSGTSVLSGLVSLMGCNIGITDTMPKRKDNPKGFFENYRIYKFNQSLLEDNGVSWDEYGFSSDDLDGALFQHYVEQAKIIISQEFAADALFFIKDPRICLLFPIWNRALQELNIECKCIVVHRSALEVALSLEDRDQFTTEKSLMIWSHYFFQSELKSRECNRIFVKYSRDFKNLDQLLLTLSNFIGVDLTKEMRINAHKFYSPKLQNQKLTLENISHEIPKYLKTMVELFLDSDFDNHASIDKIRQDFNNSIKYYLHNEKNLIHSIKELNSENKFHENEKAEYLKENNSLKQKKQKIDLFSKKQSENIVALNKKIEILQTSKQKTAIENKEQKNNIRQLNHDLTNFKHINNQYRVSEIHNLNFNNELKKRLVVADSLLYKVTNDKEFFKKIASSHTSPSNTKHLINSILSNKQRKQILNDRKTILDSGYFSPLYYMTKYRDVWISGVDPLDHFCQHGWAEARDPNPTFNTKEYLQNNLDVAQLEINPLIHFIVFGENEKRETGYKFPLGEYDINYKLKITLIENENSENYPMELLDSGENVDEKLKEYLSNTNIDFSISVPNTDDFSEVERGRLLGFKDGYVTGWYSPTSEPSLPIIKIDGMPTINLELSSNNPLSKIPVKNGFVTQAINKGEQANIELLSLSEMGLTSLHKIKSKNQSNLIDKFVDLKRALKICKDPNAVAITVWEGAHNPIGRAKVLYDIVAKNRPVILFAYVFGDFGNEVWQPIKNTNINVVLIPYAQRFEYQTIIQLQNIKFNTVWICKYRLHSFELACMIAHPETACILDIDDNEDVFINSEASKYKPYGIFSKNKADYYLHKTFAKSVASTSINKIHGGEIVRHARNQYPNKKPRKQRAGQQTAVFVGTIRPHKNIPELVDAVNKYNQSSSKPMCLVIGGDFNPTSLKHSLKSPFSSIIDEVTSEDLYETLMNHDVVITGYPDKNNENNEVNKLQITAKIGDALAIGRPVLTPKTDAVADLTNIPGLFIFTRETFDRQLTKALNYNQTISLPKEFTLDFSYLTFLKLETLARSKSQAKHIFGLDPFFGYKLNQSYNNENIVLVWKQHDSGVYGRRIDHIARFYKQNHPKCKVTVLEFISDKELTNLMQSDIQFDNFSMVLNDVLLQKLYSYTVEGVDYKLITYADKSGWNSFDGKFKSYLRSEKLYPDNTVLILFPLHQIFNQMISIVKDYKTIVDLVDNQINWITETKKRVEGLKQYYHLISIADEVVSNSSQNLEYFQDRNFFQDKSPIMIPNWYTIPNSVNFKRDVPTNEINLIYSGNLNDRIDWDLLDKICETLKNKNGYLHIVGTSVRSSDNMKKLLNNPNCTYHGVINEFQLIRLLQHINFTVVPHIEDNISKFMDPIKLKMYKKLGIISLVSDLPGLPINDPMITVAKSAIDFVKILEEMLLKIDQVSTCNLIKEKNDIIANEYSIIIEKLLFDLTKENQLDF